MSKLLKTNFYLPFVENRAIKALINIACYLLDLWTISLPKPHAFILLPLQSGFNNSIKFSYYSFINSPYFYYYLKGLFFLVYLLSIHYNSDPIYCADNWDQMDIIETPMSRNIQREDTLYSVTRIRSGTNYDAEGNPTRAWLYSIGHFRDGSVRGSMPFVHRSSSHEVALTAFVQERSIAQAFTPSRGA